jgi:hypothetical protein
VRSLAWRAVGRVAPLSAIATAVADAVFILVDESKAAAGGQGTGWEEGAGRGEGMDRGPKAGQGEDSMVGVVVVVAAVGEEVGEAVEETVGEAVVGVRAVS